MPPISVSDARREADAIRERYDRRAAGAPSYDPFAPSVLYAIQERSRAAARILGRHGPPEPRSNWRVIEIGCGTGANLLEFLSWGISPDRLVGVELLAQRAATAVDRLPREVTILEGDALTLDLPAAHFDVAVLFTVLSSVLDPAVRTALAERTWQLARRGGGVLWYDFVFDNPRNRDVRGVRDREIHQLFPEARIWTSRVTLAPPIARRLSRIHPSLYTAATAIPWLRTHRLCWLKKL